MKVYNIEKTEILENYDLEKGYLKADFIEIPEVEGVEEQGHYETIKEYPNGGKDVKWVVEVEGVEYQPAHQEEIYVYIPYTKQELDRFDKQNELNEVLTKLQETDYISNKLIEAIDDEELKQLRQRYIKEISQRRVWRARADVLKKELEV